MLNGVSIDRESMDARVSGVRVLAGKDLAVSGPATRRGFHVTVHRAVDVREPRTAARAGKLSHTASCDSMPAENDTPHLIGRWSRGVRPFAVQHPELWRPLIDNGHPGHAGKAVPLSLCRRVEFIRRSP